MAPERKARYILVPGTTSSQLGIQPCPVKQNLEAFIQSQAWFGCISPGYVAAASPAMAALPRCSLLFADSFHHDRLCQHVDEVPCPFHFINFITTFALANMFSLQAFSFLSFYSLLSFCYFKLQVGAIDN